MKPTPRIVLFSLMVFAVLALCLLSLPGCQDASVRFAPSEAQKQAADLTVSDAQALTPYVQPAGQPILAEATQAAKVTQVYVGLPASRPAPIAAGNAATLAQASTDAAGRPTIAQTINSGLDQAGKAADVAQDTASKTADTLLKWAAVVTAIGTLGYGVKQKLNANQAKQDASDTTQKSAAVVGSVDAGLAALPPEQQAAFKAAMAQVQAAPSPVEQFVNQLQAANVAASKGALPAAV
jgi:hypothetical protein